MGDKFDPYYKWLGIPPKDQPPHHYRLLGIEVFEEDREVIDAAANRLMGYLKDLAVGDEGAHTQSLLNEISRARLCLLNEKKKSEYDQQLRKRLEVEEARKPAAKGPPPKTKHPVPPIAVPPSAAAPPSTAKSRSASKPPAIIIPDLEGTSKVPGPVASPDEAIKIVAVEDKKPQSTSTSPTVEPIVEAIETERPKKLKAKKKPKKKSTRSVAENSFVPVSRHPRGVYVAAALIAIVGGVGLILTVVMSYLLLTTGSRPAPPAAEPAQVTEETPSVDELPDLEEPPDMAPE